MHWSGDITKGKLCQKKMKIGQNWASLCVFGQVWFRHQNSEIKVKQIEWSGKLKLGQAIK